MKRRFLSPIIYAISAIVVIASSLAMVDLIQSDFVQLIIMITMMGVVYWFANRLIVRLEKLQKPTVRDHVRHSSLLYAGLICCVYLLLFTDYPDGAHGLGIVIVLILIIICCAAIVVNGIFLHRLYKANIS